MDTLRINRPVTTAERLAIVAADGIGHLPPSALVRSLLALDATELLRLVQAIDAHRRHEREVDEAQQAALDRYYAARANRHAWRPRRPVA